MVRTFVKIDFFFHHHYCYYYYTLPTLVLDKYDKQPAVHNKFSTNHIS